MAEIYNLTGAHLVLSNGVELPPLEVKAQAVYDLEDATGHPLADKYPIQQRVKRSLRVTLGGVPFPPAQANIYYVVSATVAASLAGRTDLLVPFGAPNAAGQTLVVIYQ